MRCRCSKAELLRQNSPDIGSVLDVSSDVGCDNQARFTHQHISKYSIAARSNVRADDAARAACGWRISLARLAQPPHMYCDVNETHPHRKPLYDR